jgi:spore coat protein U domain-containing protein, fimbrial subunit CupE1/2/3/6
LAGELDGFLRPDHTCFQGISMIRRSLWQLAFVLAVIAFTPERAEAALTCTASITNIAFGTDEVLANTAVNRTATYSASCSGGTAGGPVLLCPSIGPGAGNTMNPRTMLSGSNTLNFDIYSNAAHTIIWGNTYVGSLPPPAVRVTLNASGSGTVTAKLYGRIPNGQMTAVPGSYVDTFTAINDYAVDTGQACSAVKIQHDPMPFNATATVPAFCNVAATAINFGSAASLASNIDATGTLNVTCTNTTPYTVTLDGGLAGATTPNARKMSFGANTVIYGLYTDAARTQGWGTAGGTTVADTGTGNVIAYTVYGRVAPQTSSPAGTYSDTVTVTVSY